MLVKFIHQMLVKILQSPWVVDDGSVNEFFITTFDRFRYNGSR